MSLHFLRVFQLAMIFLVGGSAAVHAEEWMRGAVAVVNVTGEVDLDVVGDESIQVLESDTLPKYISGSLKVRTEYNDAVFLKTSNQISIYNVGSGFFAIERFEQEVATSMDEGQSRMILNFRKGLLVVDNRALSEDSQMIVETPLGHISVKSGWWLMRIDYDTRSRLYDFSIACADGVLRFTDQLNATYTLRNGQRLSGAGVSTRPSIEVAEMSENASELFEEFEALHEASAVFELSATGFRAKMLAMDTDVSRDTSTVLDEVEGGVRKRPLVIEYAPLSAPVTPFQGLVRPPSGYQADLF